MLYAFWAVWAAELLWKDGSAKFTLIQLVTSLLLAVHVSWESVPAAQGGCL